VAGDLEWTLRYGPELRLGLSGVPCPRAHVPSDRCTWCTAKWSPAHARPGVSGGDAPTRRRPV